MDKLKCTKLMLEALAQMGIHDIGDIARLDAVMELSEDIVLSLIAEANFNGLTTPVEEELNEEARLRVLNRILMRHGVFLDEVRPELDGVHDLITGWRLEFMP